MKFNSLKTKPATKRLWLTVEERRQLARKNLKSLRNQLSKEDWEEAFKEVAWKQ